MKHLLDGFVGGAPFGLILFIWSWALDLPLSSASNLSTIFHNTVVMAFGMAIVRAIETHQEWCGSVLPVPADIGFVLVIVTGGAALLSALNLP